MNSPTLYFRIEPLDRPPAAAGTFVVYWPDRHADSKAMHNAHPDKQVLDSEAGDVLVLRRERYRMVAVQQFGDWRAVVQVGAGVPGRMKVISGGQTGVDRGALRAARAAGLATGGWMPRGWRAEDGPHPEFAELYGMQECTSAGYPQRTRRNIEDSGATLILAGDVQSPGTELTIRLCRELRKPFVVFNPATVTVSECVSSLPAAAVLNVAGNRESKSPGIEQWTERFLGEVIAELKERR